METKSLLSRAKKIRDSIGFTYSVVFPTIVATPYFFKLMILPLIAVHVAIPPIALPIAIATLATGLVCHQLYVNNHFPCNRKKPRINSAPSMDTKTKKNRLHITRNDLKSTAKWAGYFLLNAVWVTGTIHLLAPAWPLFAIGATAFGVSTVYTSLQSYCERLKKRINKNKQQVLREKNNKLNAQSQEFRRRYNVLLQKSYKNKIKRCSLVKTKKVGSSPKKELSSANHRRRSRIQRWANNVFWGDWVANKNKEKKKKYQQRNCPLGRRSKTMPFFHHSSRPSGCISSQQPEFG